MSPFVANGRWVFGHEGRLYDLAPSGIVEASLSPLIVGVDRLIVQGCAAKGIVDAASGFDLSFSVEFLPNADVLLHFLEQRYGGWVYGIEELNLKGIMPGQKVWICSYMTYYFKEPPRTLYLKIEGKS